MGEIKNSESVAHYLGRWNPSDLAFIDAFECRRAHGDEASQLRIMAKFQRRNNRDKVWPNDCAPYVKVTILFFGVINLSLKEFGPLPMQISGFDIIDVSSRGMENIQYIIEDYENGQIYFECAEVSIEEVAI